VHCGLGIGLATGKCCTEWISQQGGDFGLERIGDGVEVKTGKISFDDFKRCVLSAQDKKSLKEALPPLPSLHQSTLTHNPASLQLCERLVELQRSEELPRACFANAAGRKAGHTQM
jgi:hypothetical protein